jgi:hypothetical protein
VRAQAVSAEVALGDRQRELLASFSVEGSAGECRTESYKSFKRHRRIRKNPKEIRHQRELRSYLREESPDLAGYMIGINWLDAILDSGFLHRRLLADCVRYKTHLSCQAGALPKSTSGRASRVLMKRRVTRNRKITNDR